MRSFWKPSLPLSGRRRWTLHIDIGRAARQEDLARSSLYSINVLYHALCEYGLESDTGWQGASFAIMSCR